MMAKPDGDEVGHPLTRERLAALLNEDLAREHQVIITYVVYSQVLKGAARATATTHRPRNLRLRRASFHRLTMEEIMGFGRGALLWLLGVPLPIIILLALFWHH
jgi:predicted nucleic acid-binding protein